MPAWVLAAVIGYTLGSIPVGYVIGRAQGMDVRRVGSGATGSTNVLRMLGAKAASLTLVLDILKGLAAVLIGQRLAGDLGYAWAGAMAVAGHCYPVWLGFKGGKGVATGAGVLMLVQPWVCAIAALTFITTLWRTRYVGLGSILGAMVFCATIIGSRVSVPVKWLAALVLLVILVRHESNIKRMRNRTEHRLGESVNATRDLTIS